MCVESVVCRLLNLWLLKWPTCLQYSPVSCFAHVMSEFITACMNREYVDQFIIATIIMLSRESQNISYMSGHRSFVHVGSALDSRPKTYRVSLTLNEQVLGRGKTCTKLWFGQGFNFKLGYFTNIPSSVKLISARYPEPELITTQYTYIISKNKYILRQIKCIYSAEQRLLSHGFKYTRNRRIVDRIIMKGDTLLSYRYFKFL